MNLQSRTTPIVAKDQFAGRIVALRQCKNMLLVWIAQEHKIVQRSCPLGTKLAVGDIIVFSVKIATLTKVEKLFSADTQPSLQGDVYRWRNFSQSNKRMENLHKRHQVLKRIRDYFDYQNFLEVQTPVRVDAPNPEAVFCPVSSEKAFLQTSPEFHMKRMLVGGFEKIYQIAPCFRGDEIGNKHNPEFTLLEWYRAFARLEDVVKDLQSFLQRLGDIFPKTLGQETSKTWQRYSVFEIFEKHLNLKIQHVETGEELARLAKQAGLGHWIADSAGESYQEIFSYLWGAFEQEIGDDAPTFVYDWPLPLASLAQARQDNLRLSERVELYIKGQELANGFGELTDACQARERFEQELEKRQQHQMPHVPLDELFLNSLQEGMPPAAGMALGIERLLMILVNSQSIRDVMTFVEHE